MSKFLPIRIYLDCLILPLVVNVSVHLICSAAALCKKQYSEVLIALAIFNIVVEENAYDADTAHSHMKTYLKSTFFRSVVLQEIPYILPFSHGWTTLKTKVVPLWKDMES